MEDFLEISDCQTLCQTRIGIAPPLRTISALGDLGLLPTYEGESSGSQTRLVLRNDFEEMLPLVASLANSSSPRGRTTLFGEEIPARLALSEDTALEVMPPHIEPASPLPAAIRQLMRVTAGDTADPAARIEPAIAYPFFDGSRLVTSSCPAADVARRQRRIAEKLGSLDTGDLAKTAHYMGSKRTLAGFLVEGVSSIARADSVVLDLMCGSGAAAAAFSLFWETIASDVQEFSQLLATIQGGEVTPLDAGALLQQILPAAEAHIRDMSAQIEPFLRREDHLLHGEINDAAVREYTCLANDFPTYPGGGQCLGWDPVREVRLRQANPRRIPYCLFTAYFANVYFGIRQCIEIDALRYAIDALKNGHERAMALGALVVSLSVVGTTYAAHFAQPALSGKSKLTVRKLSSFVEKRSLSLMHEFSARLLSLAEHRQRMPRPISIVPGPWDRAVAALEDSLRGQDVIVYLDAPYKREEYSRYYHVLETIVQYNYPHSVGRGRAPDIRRGERFKSEFATRDSKRVEAHFVQLVAAVLSRGWSCAWSYSDVGDANPAYVIAGVTTQMPGAVVRSVATPHVHRSQGGRRRKKVMEYLITFQTAERAGMTG